MRVIQKIPKKWRIIVWHSFLWPLIYVLAPAVVMAYYQVQPLQEYAKIHAKWLYDILNLYCIWFVFGSISITFLIYAIQGTKNKLNAVEYWDKHVLVIVMEEIDSVVGQKSNRFANLAKTVQMTQVKKRPGDIFRTITEPETQIHALVRAVYDIFRRVWPDANYRVSLVRIKDGSFLEDYKDTFFPEHQKPKLPIEKLREPCSCASRAIRNKLVIVEDLVGELKKSPRNRNYITTEDRLKECGSMFAFRVDYNCISSSVPIYIISVCANQKGYITEEFKPVYKWIMEEIQQRISLEYSLLLLKSYVGGSSHE